MKCHYCNGNRAEQCAEIATLRQELSGAAACNDVANREIATLRERAQRAEREVNAELMRLRARAEAAERKADDLRGILRRAIRAAGGVAELGVSDDFLALVPAEVGAMKHAKEAAERRADDEHNQAYMAAHANAMAGLHIADLERNCAGLAAALATLKSALWTDLRTSAECPQWGRSDWTKAVCDVRQIAYKALNDHGEILARFSANAKAEALKEYHQNVGLTEIAENALVDRIEKYRAGWCGMISKAHKRPIRWSEIAAWIITGTTIAGATMGLARQGLELGKAVTQTATVTRDGKDLSWLTAAILEGVCPSVTDERKQRECQGLKDMNWEASK